MEAHLVIKPGGIPDLLGKERPLGVELGLEGGEVIPERGDLLLLVGEGIGEGSESAAPVGEELAGRGRPTQPASLPSPTDLFVAALGEM